MTTITPPWDQLGITQDAWRHLSREVKQQKLQQLGLKPKSVVKPIPRSSTIPHVAKVVPPYVDKSGTFWCPEGCGEPFYPNAETHPMDKHIYDEISIEGDPQRFRFVLGPGQPPVGSWNQRGAASFPRIMGTDDMIADLEKGWRSGKKVQLWRSGSEIPGAVPKLRCKPPQLISQAHSLTWTDARGVRVHHYKIGRGVTKEDFSSMQIGPILCNYDNEHDTWQCSSGAPFSSPEHNQQNFNTQSGRAGVNELQGVINDMFLKDGQPMVMLYASNEEGGQNREIVDTLDPAHVSQPHRPQPQHQPRAPRHQHQPQHRQQQPQGRESEEKAPPLLAAQQPARIRSRHIGGTGGGGGRGHVPPVVVHEDNGQAHKAYGRERTPHTGGIADQSNVQDPGGYVTKQWGHEAYDNRYLFSGDLERINYQRDDASYGGFGTARDFIQLNPNVGYHDQSKVFGYEGHTTPAIDYMLLSVAFVVFMAICCCVVIAVSFTSGYVTKWWLNKKRKTQLEDETV